MSWFLRDRQGQTEREWHRSQHSAADKSRALYVLRGSVVIVKHPYEADPFSGAGNCWCGRHEGSSLHAVVMEPTFDEDVSS